ncbi:dTDP-4-dehydrorhamnose reductase, partial [Candidatus Peregrinibacteria bacterium]|nr:dTDP-4-dehydrorhamnose reductase [Candidatus Peregrinibacteria bacterium]
TDYGVMGKVFFEIKPDIVLNCTAYTLVDDCETNKDLAFKINAEAVGKMAELSKKYNSTLIHFSTDYVFNGQNSNGYKEDDLAGPLSIYGESKLFGEQLIQKNLDKFYIIRTSWLFGENGKNFVDTMISLGKTKGISVVNDQIGAPTYTKDLGNAIIQYFLTRDPNLPYGIYHITNSGKTSWSTYAKTIFELLGMHVKVNEISSEEFKSPAKRPSYSILLSTKVDFHMRSWEDAVKEYLSLNY